MHRNDDVQAKLDPHDTPTIDLGDTANQGIDLHDDDPLPDLPDAGPDSRPITSPDPIDFSTKGISGAGAVGMSTFNDGDDQTLFERVTDAFTESGIHSPLLGDQDQGEAPLSTVDAKERFRVRIYDQPS